MSSSHSGHRPSGRSHSSHTDPRPNSGSPSENAGRRLGSHRTVKALARPVPDRTAKRLADPSAVQPSGRQSGERYVGRRTAPPAWPSRLLMGVLTGCVVVLLVLVLAQLGPSRVVSAPPTVTSTVTPAATPTPEPTPTPTPEPAPTPTPEPTPSPLPPADYSLPVPQGESADPEEWFRDAVFIGDSRVSGLHLYSGIKGASFLEHTGMTVYEVIKEEPVIRKGEEKISVLEALAEKTYGKIYIALGINELGYFDAEGFAETMGIFVDKIREIQPKATVYIQTILPVNTAKCAAHEQRYYVTNDAITAYNDALALMADEKEVWLLSPPDALLDENGETREELSADGVHFQKAGYIIWLEHLLTHTGQEFAASGT